MKNLLFLLPFLIISSYNKQKVSNKNDLEKWKLQGQVKSLRESSFWANEIFGELTKLSKYDGKQIVFNEIGNITQHIVFNVSDNLTRRSKFNYDSNNKLAEEFVYMPNGQLLSKRTYKYDKSANIIEEIEYSNHGNLSSKKKLTYDNKGKVTEEKIYHSDGRLFSSTKYKYLEVEKQVEIKRYIIMSDGTIEDHHQLKKIDNNGNETENIFYDSDGNIIRKEINKYDARGSLIESKTIYLLFDNKEHVIFNKYEYDGNGNWIKMYHYGALKSITEREIVYYK
jgi:hypothetical protein